MTKPWTHQKELKLKDIPNQNEVFILVNNIHQLRLKALITMCYLTGGRISELVKCKKLYKRLEDGSSEAYDINYNGISKKDITFINNKGKNIMLINIQNRKNKHMKRKNIPVLCDKEWRFVNIVTNYIETLKDDEPLFPFNRHWAYVQIKENTGYNPHFWRDIRATHLVTMYGLDGFRLEKFLGWTDSRPAKHYVKLNWRDIWQ